LITTSRSGEKALASFASMVACMDIAVIPHHIGVTAKKESAAASIKP
jgi:hypothetical protein